jgi:two-component system, NarL family, nitrate/nitrite response regulator NarL
MRTSVELYGSGTSAVIDEGAITHLPQDNTDVIPRVVVISPMRIYREGLAHVLGQQKSIRVIGIGARIDELAPLLRAARADVALFDLAVEGGLAALRSLGTYPGVRVVVLGLTEDEEPILACARAGIAGYVTQDTTLVELTQRIHDAALNQFKCTPQVAATLLRSLAGPPMLDGPRATAARLTPRESEIIRLIERGLSNKEIARHLTIQLATVKNHVHNILEKLDVSRRADAVRAAGSMRPYAAV